MPGEVHRYDMRRLVSLTADVHGEDLGGAARRVAEVVRAAEADKPAGVRVDVRGHVSAMRDLFGPLAFDPPWDVPPARWFDGLSGGLLIAGVVIVLMLTAYFQSVRLALVAVAPVPAVLAGVAAALLLTGTTLNLQSFMGAITAVGVATANAILLVTFAERSRAGGAAAPDAAAEAARSRVRPILMTSAAMIAGMLPLALGIGEGGDQTAPLGRAVIGGLAAGTLTTLVVLPAVFALVMAGKARSASLDPFDPASRHHTPEAPHAP
jgi:multidrug efflux pump subunit AcrB